MQRIIILFLIMASAGLIHAQSNVEVDSTTYTFGTIVQGVNPTHTFIIKNTGNAVLLINSVDVSCGCLVVDYSKTPIKPGMTGEVQIMFVSGNKKGFQLRSTNVKTNAGGDIILYMKGTVKKKNEGMKE